jgi:hypothetical protein
LVDSLRGATADSIDKAVKSVANSADKLGEAIASPGLFSAIFDPQGPERDRAKKDLKDAVKKLKAAKGIEEQKKNLLYLAALIETEKSIYTGQNNDAFKRAWSVFVSDVSNAPGILVKEVIAPVINVAAKTTMKTLWAIIAGLWPVLLAAIGVLLLVAWVKGKASK